ncbi:unnamed protein product, partial [Callosobruchus maculatus]
MDPRVDDEAPKDPAAYHKHKLPFDEKDFEGHRASSVFIGVHVPESRRHSHRRHRHHHHNATTTQPNSNNSAGTPPSQRVQFILGEDNGDEKHESHPLFSEMEELVKEGDELNWKERARWV